MAFRIITDRKFTWPVTVHVPHEGGSQEQHFSVTFLELGQKELRALTKDVPHGDERLLQKVIVGWQELMDEDNQPLPFDEAWKQRMIDIPYIRAALLKAYVEALSGAASEKNSSLPSATS